MTNGHPARPRWDGALAARATTWWWLGLGFFVELALAVNLFGSAGVPVRTLFGLPLVLAIPGYALTALLWGRRRLGGAETVVLSLGISLALAALSAILLDWTPVGIRGGQQTLLLGLIALAAIVAVLLRDTRRSGLASAAPARPARVPAISIRRRQLVLMAMAAVIVASALAYAASAALQPAGPGFTQAWIYSKDAQASGLNVGVENDERQPETYRVQLLVDGRPTREWSHVRLERGRTWSADLGLADAPRPQRAELKVYRAEDPGTIYRDVRVSLGGAGQ
jgi:uncharacterized membrane protein